MGRFVNRAGDQFFSGPGFAGDQNGFRVPGDAVDQSHELVHHRAGQNEFRVVDLAGNQRRDCGHRPDAAGLSSGALGIAGTTAPRPATTAADRAAGFRRSVAENCTGKLAPALGRGEQVAVIVALRGGARSTDRIAQIVVAAVICRHSAFFGRSEERARSRGPAVPAGEYPKSCSESRIAGS